MECNRSVPSICAAGEDGHIFHSWKNNNSNFTFYTTKTNGMKIALKKKSEKNLFECITKWLVFFLIRSKVIFFSSDKNCPKKMLNFGIYYCFHERNKCAFDVVSCGAEFISFELYHTELFLFFTRAFLTCYFRGKKIISWKKMYKKWFIYFNFFCSV